MATTKPGKRNKRAMLQRLAEVQAQSGELQKTFVDVSEYWVNIEQLSGREYFQAQQMQSAVSTRITMLENRDVTAKMRFVYTPRSSRPDLKEYYDIENVSHVGRETILMCKLGTAEGYKTSGSNV